MTLPLPTGFHYFPDYLSRQLQKDLIAAVTEVVRGDAPFYQPCMPRTGRKMSVVMSNFGPLGWVADVDGYKYTTTHPLTGVSWPSMPQILYEIWDRLTDYPAPPEACLINWYREGARMGLHVDSDEQDLRAPIVSISLGDPARYRLGGPKRGGETHALKLSSGDVIVLKDEARRCYHGVDKLWYGQTTLIPKGGRINLTMRRVNRP